MLESVTMAEGPVVTEAEIAEGLRSLGLSESSSVLVHASLRSFGYVDGGAEAVCRALVRTCGTVMTLAGSGDVTRLPAPPGLVRPHNAYVNAESWESFDEALTRAVPFSPDLPVDETDWSGDRPVGGARALALLLVGCGRSDAGCEESPGTVRHEQERPGT